MYFRNADTRYLHKQHRLWFHPIGFLRLLIMEAAHTLYTPIGELQAEKRTRSSRKQHFFHKSSNKKITGYHKEEFIAINLKILLQYKKTKIINLQCAIFVSMINPIS